jgi:hypothetical protein
MRREKELIAYFFLSVSVTLLLLCVSVLKKVFSAREKLSKPY